MGCEYYEIDNMIIGFSENDGGCLCTFPHNDNKYITIDRLASLALLGAAVVLAKRGELSIGYLPEGLPKWINNSIKAHMDDLYLLEALKNNGVDNWEGYGEARQQLAEQEKNNGY